MENNKILGGSSTTNDKNPDVGFVTSEVYLHMPPEPMGTRPCSPSESDISVYALPPPAYQISSNTLPEAPVSTITPAEIEMLPAQRISPATASTAIMAPAPAVIASAPAAVQNLSLGTPAQPASATTQSQYADFDVESTTYGRRRRHGLVDNAAVRTVRRAGGWSFWYTWELCKSSTWRKKLLFLCAVNLGISLIILAVGMTKD